MARSDATGTEGYAYILNLGVTGIPIEFLPESQWGIAKVVGGMAYYFYYKYIREDTGETGEFLSTEDYKDGKYLFSGSSLTGGGQRTKQAVCREASAARVRCHIATGVRCNT